jgi:hypothetical protein
VKSRENLAYMEVLIHRDESIDLISAIDQVSSRRRVLAKGASIEADNLHLLRYWSRNPPNRVRGNAPVASCKARNQFVAATMDRASLSFLPWFSRVNGVDTYIAIKLRKFMP